MILGIHQPNHLPWVGFWLKVAACDTFVLFDHCPLNKPGVTRRVALRQGSQPVWSTLITRGHSNGTAINEVTLLLGVRERQRLLAVIDQECGHLPNFKLAIAPFREELAASGGQENLAVFNERVLRRYASVLGLETQFLTGSEVLDYQAGPNWLVSTAVKLEAKIYLSGSGGAKSYLDPQHFAGSDCELRFADFARYAALLNTAAEDSGCSFLKAYAREGDGFRQNLLVASSHLRTEVEHAQALS